MVSQGAVNGIRNFFAVDENIFHDDFLMLMTSEIPQMPRISKRNPIELREVIDGNRMRNMLKAERKKILGFM